MECPKCGHEQPDKRLECEKCGIIFSKYIQRMQRGTAGQRREASKSIPVYDHSAKAAPTTLTEGYILAAIAALILAAGGVLFYTSLPQWRSFTSGDERFSVEFPGEPAKQSDFQRQGNVSWKTTTYHVEPLLGLTGLSYGVSVAEYHAIGFGETRFDEEKAFEGAREMVKKQFSATVESEEDVDVAGYSGREFIFDTNQGRVTVRMFFDQPRAYLLLFKEPSLDIASDKERFFNSFRVN